MVQFGEFELASSSSRRIISEKRAIELSKSYSDSERYQQLKEQLKLPPIMDFSFVFSFSEEDFVRAEREVPAGVEVFSKIERVEVLRENGSVVFADFSVAIW